MISLAMFLDSESIAVDTGLIEQVFGAPHFTGTHLNGKPGHFGQHTC
jgi:hypothetical protein